MDTLIGIAGRTAAGKTSLAVGLRTHFDAPGRRFSEILGEFARDIDAPTDKASLQKISTALRETFGENILAHGMAEWVKKQTAEYVVVEGIRRSVDVALLEKAALESGRKWALIFVDAPLATRMERYNKRLAEDGREPVNADAFDLLEHQESEAELSVLKERAHRSIDTGASTVEHIVRETIEYIQK